jgi:hypothetical protein
MPVNNMTTFDDQIERAQSNERALATLSTGFGVLALVISIVGLYGVMAFLAAQRRQEIGLRLALGATRRRLARRPRRAPDGGNVAEIRQLAPKFKGDVDPNTVEARSIRRVDDSFNWLPSPSAYTPNCDGK